MTFQADTDIAEPHAPDSPDDIWGDFDWDVHWREHEEAEALKLALHGPERLYIPQPGDEEYEEERNQAAWEEHEWDRLEAECAADGRDPHTLYCLDTTCECCPSAEVQRAERAEAQVRALEYELFNRDWIQMFDPPSKTQGGGDCLNVCNRSGLRHDRDLILKWRSKLDATLDLDANEDHRRCLWEFHQDQQARLDRRHAGVAEKFHPDHPALDLVKDGIPMHYAAVTGDDLHAHRLRLMAQGMDGFQVGRRMRVVLGFFDWAHDITYLPVNPAEDYRRRCVGPDRYPLAG